MKEKVLYREKRDNRKRRRIRRRRGFLIFIVLIFCVLFGRTVFMQIYNTISSHLDKYVYDSPYEIIKMDNNDNYGGTGQEKLSGLGYFTKFTTAGENPRVYIEYKQNIEPWGQNEYWGGTMEDNGCGITAMAIVLSAYNNDLITPEDLRQKYYPSLDYTKMSKELKSYGIDNTDFFYDAKSLSKEKILEHLKTNRPVIVCLWNKPEDNRFTTKSHYMVLLACDDDAKVYVSNPNGGENDYNSSGWYDIEEVTKYLAKLMYIKTY